MEQVRNRQERRKAVLDISTFSKVPPQAIEAEKAVLGACMMDKDGVDTMAAMLTAESFYVTAHQLIFTAILNLHRRNRPIDVITVVEELTKMGEIDKADGPRGVMSVTNSVTGSKNITAHCRIIKEKYLQRQMIVFAGNLLHEAYSDETNVNSMLEKAEQELLNIGSENVHSEMTSINEVIPKAFMQIEDWRKHDTAITGIPCGIFSMDRATRGWQPEDLIILAARPSIGKTALALQIARYATQNQVKPTKVAFFSLEMSSKQIVLRLLSAQSQVVLQRIQTGRLDDEQMEHLWEKGGKVLAKDNIFFDDSGHLTLFSLSSKARRLLKKKNIGLIVIDYLQLMSGEDSRANREQEVSKISRGLKQLARDLQLPVIALSQLGRDVEKRTGKKREPVLADLRESGAIEQDADVVILLWGPDEDEAAEDADIASKRYWKIAKQRSGVLARGELEFKNHIQLLVEQDKTAAQLPAGNWTPVPEVINITEASKIKFQDEDEPPF